MRNYTCDRCKKKIDERVMGESIHHIGRYKDVCQKCYDKVLEFIEKGKDGQE